MNLLWFNLRMDRRYVGLSFAIDWVNAAAEHVDSIDVLTMYKGDYTVRPNVRVHSAGLEHGWSKPRRAVEFYRRLNSLLSEQQYDGCFAHMMPLFALMGSPLLHRHDVPVTLWYAHGDVSPTLRWAARAVDGIVTSSPDGFRLSSPKVRVVGQGIDTRRFYPSDADGGAERPFTLVSVGRISPIKHVELMIQGVAMAREYHGLTDVRLRLIGDTYPQHSVYAHRMHALAHEFGVADQVEFVGPRRHEEVPADYRAADAILNLSDTGSLDKAVLEGMSSGLPVLTSNEAYSELFGELTEICYIDEPDPAEVGSRIAALAALSATERTNMGRRLRHIVERDHSQENLIHRVLQVVISPRQGS